MLATEHTSHVLLCKNLSIKTMDWTEKPYTYETKCERNQVNVAADKRSLQSDKHKILSIKDQLIEAGACRRNSAVRDKNGDQTDMLPTAVEGARVRVSPLNLSADDVLWIVGSLSNLHQIPFDARLVRQRLEKSSNLQSLREILQELGLDTRFVESRATLKSIRKAKTPLVAFSSENVCSSGQAAPAIILRVDEEQILFCRSGKKDIDSASAGELPNLFSSFLVVTRQVKLPSYEEDEDLIEKKRFGFGWFKTELRKYSSIWRQVIWASLLIQILGLAAPLFTQVIIDKVVVHQTKSTLVVVVVALLMFTIFSSVMTWLRQYLVMHTGNRIDAVLGSRLFQHLFRLPAMYFEKRSTGTLISRFQGLETVRAFVTGAAVSLVLDLPFVVIFLAVMFWYSWQLSLIAVAVLALIAAISIMVSPKFKNLLNKQFMVGARNQAFLTEYVGGLATVKSLQMEPSLERRYGDLLSAHLSATFATRQLSNTYNVAANTLEQLMTLTIVAVGAILVMRNDGFTIGMLVAFQMFTSRLSQPVMRIVGLWQEFQQANIAIKRLGDIMDMPPESYALIPTRMGDGRGEIEISDLSFRYGPQQPFLYRGLNIKLEGGKICVLTGSNGSGKSTLAKLLQGFYEPVEGRIAIDGKDIRHMACNELRSMIGVVPQETVLFSGTIYENLQIANSIADFNDIANACRFAGIHDVIEQLPEGYQTVVGENGIGLSGGQRQRISIARALLKRPRLLILDESTSNLDAASVEAIVQTVMKLRGSVTMVIISHNLPKSLVPDQHVDLSQLRNASRRPSTSVSDQEPAHA